MKTSLENLSKEELLEMLQKVEAEKNQQTQKAEHFKFLYDQLRRLVFGTKRERFIKENNPHQQILPFEETPSTDTQKVKEKISYEREKSAKRENHPGRNALPSHLPVEETIIEPAVNTAEMVCIGKEVSERLEHIPAKLFIQRIIRPKYALKAAEQSEEKQNIVIGEMPSFAIDKAIAGNGLLASIFVDKFVDHLPFYRQVERFKREGVEINSSTIDGWQTQLTALLAPLYECLKNKILQQGYVQADESPVQVMDQRKDKKTSTGYHWVYYSPIERMVLFDFRPTRGREGPEELLKNFKGYLQTDGYPIYDEFNNRKEITLVGCMAHARRYFDKALDNDKVRAEHVLSEMQKLYIIERTAKEYAPEQRHAYRLDHAQPIMEELIKWLCREQQMVLPKSPIGKAISYTINRWEYIRAYLYDGALQIDNNLIENSIRTLAIGRKNYLFAGSHNGGKSAAMFYSFFGTCKKHNINPYLWLKKVLDVIPDYHANKLQDLLPQNLKLD